MGLTLSQIERAAKAAYHSFDDNRVRRTPWELLSEDHKNNHRQFVRAAFKALEAEFVPINQGENNAA